MTKNLITGALALSICASIALAQAPDQARRMDDRTMVKGQMPEMWLFKASDLIGKEVRNSKDEKLGKINEMTVNTTDGHIAYAVLQFGGFLGVGDKLFAIPFEALQLKPRDRARDNELIFIFDVDKDRLKAAPGFDQNAWPDMADATWATNVRGYWEKESALNPRVQRAKGQMVDIKQVRRINKELTGRDIKNSRFEDIGDVNDLMVDVINGYVVYVVAKLDDKANATDEGGKKINGELVALPWGALKLEKDKAEGTKDTFVLNIPDNKFQGVPAFPDRNWPNMNDMAWNAKVYNFYGVPGFWQA